MIQTLINELDSDPHKAVLVPAPEPHFEGHKIRAPQSGGPLWLKLLREREQYRVKTYHLRAALVRLKNNNYQYESRYIKLARLVISGEIFKEMYS